MHRPLVYRPVYVPCGGGVYERQYSRVQEASSPRNLPVNSSLRNRKVESSSPKDAITAISEGLLALTKYARCIKDELESGTDANALIDALAKMKSEVQGYERKLDWIHDNVAFPKLVEERKQKNAPLLEARKQEKREKVIAKLQHDLQVIRNRRKYNGHLLQAFPLDAFERPESISIWKKILGYLSDPSDINSAYFTCPTFASILEERRKLLLLPEALLIIFGKYKLERRSQRFGGPHCLELLEVSKAWKKIADQLIYEQDFMDESWYTNFPVNFEFGWRQDTTEIRNKEEIDEMLNCEALTNGKTSPCLLRKLLVAREAFPEGHGETRDKILNFLDHHGASIWFFKYTGVPSFTRSMDDYGHLWEMLEMMPNLKALELKSVTKPEYGCSPEEIRSLEEALERKPFPMLQSLKHFSSDGGVNERLLEAVYRRCSHLRSVARKIDAYPNPDVNERMEMALGMLSLERCVQDVEYDAVYSPAMNLISTWPLRVLQLNLNESHNCSVSWSSLNVFQATLEDLILEFNHGSRILRDGDQIPLHLPNLRVLRLGMVICDGTIGFDDLLPLASLEKLSIWRYDEKSRAGDKDGLVIVDVFGMKTEMKESNIWKCFPSLQELEFQGENLKYVKKKMAMT